MTAAKPLGNYCGEVPDPPTRRGARVRDAQGDTWRRGTKWWRCEATTGGDEIKLNWRYLVRWYGPVEVVDDHSTVGAS